MKNLKKYICLSVFAFALVLPFLFFTNQSDSKAGASSIASNFYDCVTVSSQGQILTENNFFEDEEGNTYIYCDGAVSFNINPFTNNYYSVTFSTENYTSKKGTITVDSSEDSFEFEGTTYYFKIASATNTLNIYISETSTSPIATTSATSEDILSYQINNGTITISYTYIYTLLASAPDSSITIETTNGTADKDGTLVVTQSQLYILRPKVNFSNASNAVINFTTYDDDGNILDDNDIIQKEQTFEKVQIEFIENSYTKQNPLYFSINYNGFTYDYILYSETYDGISCLFVEYYDDNNSSNNNSLATTLDENSLVETRFDSETNNFYLIFTETGRYSFEIYDSTYICGMNNSNYYSTSFYIVDKGATVTTFDNIYIIAQILDDDGNEIEYIVSNSTLNNDVYVTIKNLANLETGESLEDVVDRIEIVKALLTGSNNKPSTDTYSISEIIDMIDENGDLNLLFDEDAYYEIYIYPKNDTSDAIYYNFTLVKLAKTSFTIRYDDLSESYTATIPYYTETISYVHQINSTLQLSYKFTSTSELSTIFKKSYTNEFVVYYGVEQVEIVKSVSVTTDEDGNEVEEDDGTSITLLFYGVGDLTVTVEINEVTTTYYLNYEEGDYSLTFTEYGTYNVTLVDSMGSSTTGSFTLSKSLSTSAIILIVLVCVIAAFIIIFIIRIRANVKTR